MSNAKPQAMAPVAVITGASAGLGAEFARQLAGRGERQVLVARRKDRLNALASELGNARALALDLGEPGAAGRLLADIADHGEQVAMLVNNAGFGLGVFCRARSRPPNGDDRPQLRRAGQA